MSLFQAVLLIVAGILFAASLWALFRGRVRRWEGGLSALVWLIAALAIIWPNATTRIAHAVGLGRGINLLVYCTVVTVLVGFTMVYVRLRKLRREMTLLVRQLALANAEAGPDRSPEGISPVDDTSEQK